MEEETKEIKDLKEINDVSLENEDTETLEVEKIDENEIVTEDKTSDDKKSNKKLYMILGIISSIIVILLIIFIFIIVNKKKPVQEEVIEDSLFFTTMKKAIDNETLKDEISKGLRDLSINTDKVMLLYMDIDSDYTLELVAYAEDDNNKGIIQIEINDDIMYEDVYSMDSIDSIGYVYSNETNNNSWYVLKDKNYTLISSAKKIIKEEDFLNNFFIITQTYHKKAIIQNAIVYRMGKDLDIKKLEDLAFTNENLLFDNNITDADIKDGYNKYLEQKKEEEEKKKQEEEEKARLEKEKQRLEGRLQLGNISYRYGTYNIILDDGSIDGTLIIYSDRSCVHKGVSCTYEIETITPSDDEMIPIIALSTGHIYKPGAIEGELTDEEETVTIRYAS